MENKVTMMMAVKEFWSKIFDYKTSTSLKEYWLIILFQLILGILSFALILIGNKLFVEGIINSRIVFTVLSGILTAYLVISLIPWVALTIRRLREAGRSGWWTLLLGIVGLGLAILLLLCTVKRTNGPFDPADNIAVCVYGPPSYFGIDEEDIVTPVIGEPDEYPNEVYGPPEFFEEVEDEDDQ